MFPCANCGATIDAESEGECYAARCGWVHCIYCGRPWIEECEHLLSSGAEPCDTGVFDYSLLPFIEDEAFASAQWSASQLVEAFGDVAKLLDAYNDDLLSSPSDIELVNLMRERFGLPVIIHIFQQAGMGGGGITVWSPNPQVARPQAETLLERLREGFDVLRSMEPIRLA